ncbi:Cation_efflux family protein [Hexamita inflata]|uniref:Cation efflux family protein n=1 Tax=Hexamita inflata TaxID=28002 RepID=A0AA86TT53_9EUKA|nr:Cation efflux family protein [Hexamita inflata]
MSEYDNSSFHKLRNVQYTEVSNNSSKYFENVNAGVMPIIPVSFSHLYNNENFDTEYALEGCNCVKALETPYLCNFMQNAEFKKFFEELPLRLSHLEKINPSSKQQIRQSLFDKAILLLSKVPHCTQTVSHFNPNQSAKYDLHIYQDLKNMFPVEWQQHIEPQSPVKENGKRNGKLMINLSFMSSFVLLVIILIALALSKSMSILATAMDLLLEILSGIVLFISVRLAKLGIKQGEFQQAIHYNNPDNIKYIYAQRYESLGVLSFSCIMGTCSIVLAAGCIGKIMSIIHGVESNIEFGIIPMSIIVFTLFIKVFLVTGCHIAAKQNPLQKDALLAYRDDHRNDIMSNSLGFIGAMLSSNLKGKWELCDPIASFILSIYILCNWAGNALTQMKQLAGYQADQKVLDDMMMRLLHQFNPKITEVEGFVGYQSGQQIVLEITLKVSKTATIKQAHDICQKLQNGFEAVPGIERCFVHMESDDCKNEF